MREASGQDGVKRTRFTLSHKTTTIKKTDKIYGTMVCKPLYIRNEGDVMSEKWDVSESDHCSVYCPEKILILEYKQSGEPK